MNDDNVPVINEWEAIATSLESAEADMPPPTVTEEVIVSFKKNDRVWTKTKLYELFIELQTGKKLPKNADKRLVFDTILESGKVEKVDENTFKIQIHEGSCAIRIAKRA
jgi:hypothetical protein